MAMTNEALEVEVKNLKDTIIDMRDNHLHTIYIKLDELNKALMSRLPAWATIIFGLMTALIAGLVVYSCMR